jgi:urease accessory protein
LFGEAALEGFAALDQSNQSDCWLAWQLVDSAFPTGGFAHSGGLEAAWQRGWVPDSAALLDFLRAAVRQTNQGVRKYARSAWRNPDRFAIVDEECDLFLNCHVANRASRGQGKAFLASSAKILEIPSLSALALEARKTRMPTHFAPVFGVVSHLCGLPESHSSSMFLFISVRSVISAAVRLGIVGPIEAQQIQRCIAKESGALVHDGDSDAVQISPLLDLLQGTQDRLYSRLFQS